MPVFFKCWNVACAKYGINQEGKVLKGQEHICEECRLPLANASSRPLVRVHER